MTNEQAILILKSMCEDCRLFPTCAHTESACFTALDMAIEALSNNKKQTDSLIRTSTDSVSATDVIYRADAIDAVKSYFTFSPLEGRQCAKAVERVPSAQPEIIRCKDCKWWDKSENSLFGYCMAMKHGYMSANWEIGIYRRYKGDFYCADAERENNET